MLLAIQAYIDDSGVKGTDPVFVLAGLIGKAEQWAEFSTAWKKHLRESPSIAYFKMAEAAKLGGEFRFWKHADRDRKLRGCVEVIKRYAAQHAIHCTMDLEAFRKRESRSYEKPGPVSHPYLLGSYVVLSGVCYEVLDSGSQDQIEIIFDQQLIFAPRLKLVSTSLKGNQFHQRSGNRAVAASSAGTRYRTLYSLYLLSPVNGEIWD